MKSVLASLVMLGTSLAASAALAQAKQDFQLVNRTGYTINEVYVGPNTSEDWGSDILGDQQFENGKVVNIRFNPRAQVCKWDILVVYDDKDKSPFRNIDLCEVSKITLYWNRQAGTTRFETE